MDTQEVRGTPHPLFMKDNHFSHKSNPCKFINSLLPVHNKPNFCCNRKTNSIYIEIIRCWSKLKARLMGMVTKAPHPRFLKISVDEF